MTILFATTNNNKVAEISAAVPESISVLSLKDISAEQTEIDEPYETLEENAVHKAVSYAKLFNMNCFSEDTGLEVVALKGAPGVLSARYAGTPSDTQKNMQLVLKNLEHANDRNAQFKTVIALILDEQIHTFEGVCKGTIIEQPTGQYGFGYDPIFIPEGANKTFGEMTTEEKNRFSHRKKALYKMIEFLKTNA
jgi:XTP/dITP diphosphohydrolase